MSNSPSDETTAILARTIRELRERLLKDLGEALRGDLKLGIADPREATLDAAAGARRARLDRWVDERANPGTPERPAAVERLRDDVIKQAAYTLLHRLIYLRLLEAAGLRELAVVSGGWASPGYRDFRELAPELIGDESEGYALLLQIVFDELALDLPGLYGRHDVAQLVRVPHRTLRHVIEELDREPLARCWTDDMTLGWVYQYWNDPEREALDEAVKNHHRIQRHEIASKTQLFTDRYMVDWLLQNSLGPMWLAICQNHGWTPAVERHGTLDRLDRRRADWRRARAAAEVRLTESMPLANDEERRWAYYVAAPIPAEAIAAAPDSIRNFKLLDPAVGSGHFLVVAFDLLVALYREEAKHREQTWSDAEIAESILANNLHGIDIDPRAVQIAAAAVWLKSRQFCRAATPGPLNLVASKLGLAEFDADHLGSLLRIPDSARTPELEDRLAARTSSADLGLRLRGEPLSAGVRFVRMLRDAEYDVVIFNPPYHSAAKLAPEAASYRDLYPGERADLFAAFIRRSFELLRVGGISASVTLGNWMYLRAFSSLREWALGERQLVLLGDLGKGAFQSGSNLISASMQVFRNLPPSPDASPSIALRVYDSGDVSTDADRPRRNAAALACAVGRHEFDIEALRVVPEWPLLYWWTDELLGLYARHSLLEHACATRRGASTGNNARFVRSVTELRVGDVRAVRYRATHESPELVGDWVPYIKGAAGRQWMDSLTDVINWRSRGLELCLSIEHAFGAGSLTWKICNTPWDATRGVAYSTIGESFSARAHRYHSLVDVSGATLVPTGDTQLESLVCRLNSSSCRRLVSDLNPTVNYQLSDITRLPYAPMPGAHEVFAVIEAAFAEHESRREASVEFLAPGPSPWRRAQAWAQLVVDGMLDPDPAPTLELDPEPATDHLSFALGVALGRFATARFGGRQGVLDPEKHDLSHALPDGILFLDGTLGPDELGDSLAHPAATLLHEAWVSHRPPDQNRSGLREWLRLDFFAIHRSMYDGRPIHWPLSSAKKTYVAWINIHRWTATSLRTLLADHLNPARLRLMGLIADLRAARQDQRRLTELDRCLAELTQFIADVRECAERGPASADPKQARRDAPYQPDLADGVMINASALHLLLTPQWADPQKWWQQLCAAKGRKDYDWSKLAARYFPERVEQKCKLDPSLALAHGRLWRHHPERAQAWQQRLRAELDPAFTLAEDSP